MLWKAAREQQTQALHHQYAIVTLAFVGTWSTLALPYYVSESYASGQLQSFLLPLGVCLCGLLSLCYRAMPQESQGLGSALRLYARRRAVWLFPVSLSIAVGFGAILQTPYPSVAINGLTHPDKSNGFRSTLSADELSVARAYARSHGGGDVGYLGANANYVKLLTNAPPRILYDDPTDFALSRTAHRLGCQFVHQHPTRWLVVPWTIYLSLAPATYVLGKRICGIYEPWPLRHELSNTFFKLRTAAST
jgi:hypothetical protein